MPFNFAWIIAIVGGVIALMVWARTKRAGPAISVFLGGLIIMVLADPSTLTSLAEQLKRLLQTALDQGINS